MKILVTAGPTREKIDPVRFISNYSTGTFGYELAGEAARRGHDVTLVSGPTCLGIPAGVRRVMTESASQMRREVKLRARQAGCVIMAAAVCDWKVRTPSRDKIKRHCGIRKLVLEENPDILQELGEKKRGVLVGFALETDKLEKNALLKLKKKNLDIIVANKVAAKSSLFGAGPTDILIIDKFFNKEMHKRRTKKALAKIILDKISNFTI